MNLNSRPIRIRGYESRLRILCTSIATAAMHGTRRVADVLIATAVTIGVLYTTSTNESQAEKQLASAGGPAANLPGPFPGNANPAGNLAASKGAVCFCMPMFWVYVQHSDNARGSIYTCTVAVSNEPVNHQCRSCGCTWQSRYACMSQHCSYAQNSSSSCNTKP